MATKFKLPELGENITSGTVGKILVSEGDIIEAGQHVLEIETDKAVAEIPCPTAGKIAEIRISEGDQISTGDVILVIDEDAAAKNEPAAKADTPDDAGQKSSPPPAKLEVSKQQSGEDKKDRPSEKEKAAPAASRSGVVRAAPSVRRLARELDIDITDIPLSDPAGKVTAEDVRAFASQEDAPPDREKAEPSARTDEDTSEWHDGEGTSVEKDQWGVIVKEAMNTIRLRTAERLSSNWAQIPHVTHFDKADISELEDFRKAYVQKFKEKDAGLTITAFVIKVLGTALKHFPHFNASVDMKEQRLILKQYYHLGVAVDTEKGLVVPVIRHVDKKSLLDISVDLATLSRRARERKLALEEMQGGTFTVSNLGGLGGHAFTPIINAPEVAILGISRSNVEAVYCETSQTFTPRLMLPLSLSYDHRIIDGADAARFLRYVVEAIEQPWRLHLGL